MIGKARSIPFSGAPFGLGAATLIATLLTASPALAERWRQIPGAPNATLSIDMDSIKREGATRIFQIRTTAPGIPGEVRGVVAMHCTAGVTELRAQRRTIDGKVVQQRAFPLGKRPRQKIKNPKRDPAFRIVCG